MAIITGANDEHGVLDRINTTSLTEEHGVIKSLTRECLISGLSDGSIDAYVSALNVLNTNGMTPWSLLTDFDDSFGNLVLTDRDIDMLSPSQARVVLRYDHFAQRLQYVNSPSHGYLYARFSTSLAQETKSESKYGSQYMLSHMWPDGSDKFVDADGKVLEADPDYPGVRHVQGVEVSYMVPRETIEFEGVVQTATPTQESYFWLGAINANYWMGRAPYTVLCTRADHEVFDLTTTPSRHVFRFSFDVNQDGWRPRVSFRDPRTGLPPPGLVPGEGWKLADMYRKLYFSNSFILL